jgi:hypothetical protein
LHADCSLDARSHSYRLSGPKLGASMYCEWAVCPGQCVAELYHFLVCGTTIRCVRLHIPFRHCSCTHHTVAHIHCTPMAHSPVSFSPYKIVTIFLTRNPKSRLLPDIPYFISVVLDLLVWIKASPGRHIVNVALITPLQSRTLRILWWSTSVHVWRVRMTTHIGGWIILTQWHRKDFLGLF